MSARVTSIARHRPPTVSVVIPAYNAGRTIDAALASVFAQTWRDFEVIVVDDGSTDDTRERLAAWADRVTVLEQPNGGPARARNTALACARGKLVAFLDADDVWFATKLERQVAYFREFPETGLLHTEATVSRQPHAVVFETPEPPARRFAPPVRDFCRLFHLDQTVKTLTVMAPAAVLAEAGLFDERRDIHVEDWDLWLRIAAQHPVGFLPEVLAVHRPGGHMSTAEERTFRGQRLVIDKNRELCAEACDRHRANPGRCLSAREHLLHTELGYRRFWRGDAKGAREAFRGALMHRPDDRKARGYVAASYVGGEWVRPLRRWRLKLAPPPGADVEEPTPAPNLVHDTLYRRTRAAAASRLHQLDDAIFRGRGEKRRVIFEAASPLSMAVFRPVFNRLREDPRLELWFTANDSTWNATAIFAAAGVGERVITPQAARRAKFDAYINTDFWNMTWLPRRTRRVHLFHGVAGKYGLDAPLDIAPVVAAFDRLLFANRDRLQRYLDAGLLPDDSPCAALVGYPKVDCLVDGSLDAAAIGATLGLDPTVPTVLYAPTWSPHSSLNAHGESVLHALAALDVNVVVKLHDRSLDASDRGAGGIDWRARLAQLGLKRRVHLAEGADASPYLYIADVLVTDHSSVGFEYMLLDRPIVVVKCPELLKHGLVNPQKAALLQGAAFVVGDGALTGDAVRSALTERGRHSAARRAIAQDLFYRPGGATARAVANLYELLALPAPSVAPLMVSHPMSIESLEVRVRHTS